MRALLPFLALPLAVLGLPASPDSAHDLAPRDEILPYRIENGCDDYKKMLEAVEDAKDLAKLALDEYWDKGEHGEVGETYLAIKNDGKYKDNKGAQIAEENLKRILMLSRRQPLLGYHIDISCTDKFKKCDRVIEGTRKPIAGYAENNGNTYDIVLCEPWFLTNTLDDAYDSLKDVSKEDVSLDYLGSDAARMLHELMHINWITEDRPHVNDIRVNGARLYGPERIADWIRGKKPKTEEAVNNADNYAWFVTAIYMKKKFGFLPPPSRQKPLESNLECYGDGDEWVEAKLAEAHIDGFCEKAAEKYKEQDGRNFAEEYSKDTPEHVEFKLTWGHDPLLPADEVEGQCLESMPNLLHHCDTDSGYKHGAAMTWGDNEEFVYYINPKHERPDMDEPAGSCDVYYKFMYDEFWIYGAGWAGDDYGQDELLPNLRRCGVVSSWTFDYYDEYSDAGMEWKAKGKLPIGAHQWDCVRQAVVDSGGPPNVGCGGK